MLSLQSAKPCAARQSTRAVTSARTYFHYCSRPLRVVALMSSNDSQQQQNTTQVQQEEPNSDSERQEALDKYTHGEYVEIEEQVDEEETPGATKMHVLARVGGSAVGAALAGGAALAAGLPLATVGAGAAVMGAVAGAAAGRAVSKEWVRGEDINEAMEFDVSQSKTDEAVRDEAGANTVQAADDNGNTPAHRPHVFSFGSHHKHPSHKHPNAHHGADTTKDTAQQHDAKS